jgi:hypothetical protein
VAVAVGEGLGALVFAFEFGKSAAVIVADPGRLEAQATRVLMARRERSVRTRVL